MNSQVQDLNESRFLHEELNLDEEMSEDEVIERAEELGIDDLGMARQSLTKQLDPEWRPYCNRKGDVYYINLMERRAYMDHPIDMYFKKIYAQSNSLPSPRFRSYKIEDVATSLKLIEEQIQNFQLHQGGANLKIVYEQASEQQAQSSCRTPKNDFHQSLNPDEEQQVLIFQAELQKQYQQELASKLSELTQSFNQKQQLHEQRMQQISKLKIKQICDDFHQQLIIKNKYDYSNQREKIEQMNHGKKNEYAETIEKFSAVMEEIREKQRNMSYLVARKQELEKIEIIEGVEYEKDLARARVEYETKQKLKREFAESVMHSVGGSRAYQQMLKKQLDSCYSLPGEKDKHKQRNKCLQKKYHLQNNYETMLQQIKNEHVWTAAAIQPYSFCPPNNFRNKASLNLRLRMRIV